MALALGKVGAVWFGDNLLSGCKYLSILTQSLTMAASGACWQITTARAVPDVRADVRATKKVLEENADYAGKADQIMVAFLLLVQFLL